MRRVRRVTNCIMCLMLTAVTVLSSNGMSTQPEMGIAGFGEADVLTAQAANLQNQVQKKAPAKTLKMATARALALEESTSYFQAEQGVASKRASVSSSQKAVKMQKKDWSTFRWSPLLKFKFPRTPSEKELYELELKPVTAQAALEEAIHGLLTTKLGIYEEINSLYVDIVVQQRTIAFNQQRLETLNRGIATNKARLLTGEASQGDIDTLVSKQESTTNKIASARRNLEASLRKLSNKIGTDVSTGYNFETPFIQAQIPRTDLDQIIQHTLDYDQTYFKACMEETAAKAALQHNYSLMRRKYGSDINIISGYVNQVLNGQQLKGSQANAFKKDYDRFLVKIDSYWEGKRRILFIKVPRLWFKGDNDGTRYIQEDPEELYTNVMDYNEAVVGKKDARVTLEETIIDTYENYISVRNSYNKAVKDVEKAEKDLKADLLRNRIGELSFEEYNSEEEDYEELQNSMLDMMKTYSQTLFAFDKLTLGGVSQYLEGNDSSLKTATTALSYVEKDVADGAFYYLKQIVQEEAFELYVSIPEDFEVSVSHFELWCDKVQIGERTEVGKRLRHLALTKSNVSEVKIRLYDGDEFVDDIIIDPDTPNGPLPIVTDRRVVTQEKDDLGTYSISRNDNTGMVTVTMEITGDDSISFYQVKTEEGVAISGEKQVPVKKGFTHLALIEDGLKDLTIEFYNAAGGEVCKGRFDVSNHKIKKKTEE